jgi:molecular chaperone DnaJ
MENYYNILGVQENSDQDSIKKAYREMAKKYHPDRNKEPDAEERFKKITEAYENIGDQVKRQEYDRKRNFNNSFSSAFNEYSNFDNNWNINDPFANHYSHGKGFTPEFPKGTSLNITLKLYMNDILKGVDKRIKIKRDKKCKPCSGTGSENGVSFQTCGTCKGSGFVTINRTAGFVQMNSVRSCDSCGGEGKVVLEVCLYCLGNGLKSEEDIIDVNIPAGASDGMQFVITAKGNEGKGNGKSGDLYVKIKEILNPGFLRRGVDLISSKQITFIEAILGTNIDVEMPDGEKVKAVVSPGTIPGTVLSFAQKGVPVLGYGGIGNFLVELNVKIPDNLTDEQKEFLEELKNNEIFN